VLKKLGAQPEGELKAGFRRDHRRDAQFLWSLSATDLQQPALVRERFSREHASGVIRQAVARVADTMYANRRTDLLEPPPLYPFFITRPPG
jgi:hypothetical protein